MVHGPGWRREKGLETDRLIKTASTHPHRPSTHMIPLLKETPGLFGWYAYSWAYSIKVRASGRSRIYS